MTVLAHAIDDAPVHFEVPRMRAESRFVDSPDLMASVAETTESAVSLTPPSSEDRDRFKPRPSKPVLG
jgi:hypothetical protein